MMSHDIFDFEIRSLKDYSKELITVTKETHTYKGKT